MRRQSYVLFNEVNLAAPKDSPVVDISLDSGYSLHFVLTGSLQVTSEIWAGNSPDPTKMSALSGTAAVINNTGYINNTSFAQYDYFFVRLSNVSGAGNLKCNCTVKEI